MSDQGDKTCPLCAEEMDLTDQQLKPCRCGYEICVWCWHHIMDMAEKDEAEGRCPACRTPYDKERVVGMAANCGRLVAEVNMERKQKSQKAKIKTSESRKQLSSVRVIQRNLVYIVGLPLDLADEDILQSKEYFAQYGKVLKVSMSRTSAGTIQQFANNTCSVYITYSKEEEAVRCIQSVHGFILDGRALRACFGTTKYCHAWLRNVPCSNPDCLYLHEVGSQEDSFTKDEIISAYTRSRVQQITGVTSNMQWRSGSLLPPPVDDFCNNSSAVIGKPVLKSSLSNSAASSIRGSPPSSSSGRSGALPPAASWGARASNSRPPGSSASSNGQNKQKAEVIKGPLALSTTVSGSVQASMIPCDVVKKGIANEDTNARQTKNKSETLDAVKQHSGLNSSSSISEVSSAPLAATAVKTTYRPSSPVVADADNGDISVPPESIDGQPCYPGTHKGGSSIANGNIKKLCSEISSTSIDKPLNGEHTEVIRPNGLCLDSFLSPGSQSVQWNDSQELRENSTSAAAGKHRSALDSLTASREASDLQSDFEVPVVKNQTSETEDDFDNQRHRDAIVVSQTTMSTSSPLHLLSHLRSPLQNHDDAGGAVNYILDPPSVNRMPEEGLNAAVASNGFLDDFVDRASSPGNSCLLLNGGQGHQIGRFDCELDTGESNIISNILSLDLDCWDDSLTSPQNLAKLLSETGKQEGHNKLANSWKGYNSNQSRFSFARQECRNSLFDFEPRVSNISQAAKSHSFNQASVENRDPYLDRLGNGFGYLQHNMESLENLTSGHSVFSSSKPSLSRSQISAPPGFAIPSRPPPPGFSSHERSDQSFEIKSGNHLFETSSLLRNPHQVSPSVNINTVNDIEFMDPAILAVGRGRPPSGINNLGVDMRPNFRVQPPAFESESRLQLLMQRSLSPHQDVRYTDVRDNLSPPNDAYGFTSRHTEMSQAGNLSPFSHFSLQQARNTVVSNGHRDGWNEIQAASDLGMADLLRNDRLGFNKFYGSYDDSKFRMTNSGDLYNRSFRM